MPKLAVCISGPTGVGKTALGVKLAQLLGGEIISIDSMQIYKNLDIGTNKLKDSPVPQHMLDLSPADAPMNALTYVREISKCMDRLYERGTVPILVGGSAFYFDLIFNGLPGFPEIPESVELVASQICQRDDSVSWEHLGNELSAIGLAIPTSIFANDYYRLKRALAVQLFTGKNVVDFGRRKGEVAQDINWHAFYLQADRSTLYVQLDRRCEQMVKEGLIDEASSNSELLLRDTNSTSKSIGYREALGFLSGVDGGGNALKEFEDFLERFKARTRNLVRKQELWFLSKLPHFCFIKRRQLDDSSELDEIADRIVRSLVSESERIKLKEADAKLRSAIKSDTQRQGLNAYRSHSSIFLTKEEKLAFLEDRMCKH